jgi:hypothetical protein
MKIYEKMNHPRLYRTIAMERWQEALHQLGDANEFLVGIHGEEGAEVAWRFVLFRNLNSGVFEKHHIRTSRYFSHQHPDIIIWIPVDNEGDIQFLCQETFIELFSDIERNPPHSQGDPANDSMNDIDATMDDA